MCCFPTNWTLPLKSAWSLPTSLKQNQISWRQFFKVLFDYLTEVTSLNKTCFTVFYFFISFFFCFSQIFSTHWQLIYLYTKLFALNQSLFLYEVSKRLTFLKSNMKINFLLWYWIQGRKSFVHSNSHAMSRSDYILTPNRAISFKSC